MKILRCDTPDVRQLAYELKAKLAAGDYDGPMHPERSYETLVEETIKAVLDQMVDVDLEVMLAGWHRHCYSLPYPSPLPTFEEYLKEQLGVKHDTTQP